MRQTRLSRFGLLAPVLTAFIGLSAHAQTPDAGSLQQELQKQIPQPQALPKPQAPKQKPVPREAKPTEVKVVIKGFRVDGNKSVPDAPIQDTLRSWVGKSVPFEELQKAADAVAALYPVYGRLAQVTVPPQKIADGVVVLKVLEAKLGAVHLDFPNGPSRFSADRARKYITDNSPVGDLVQTQNIERSVYILNETPGIAVTTQLEPGKNDGDVDLRVSLADLKPFQGKVEVNNYGSRSTGTGQRIASMTLNNPTSIGDQLSLSNIKSDGSDYSLASYSLPLNTDGLRLGMNASYLDYGNVNKFAYPRASTGGFGRSHTVGMNLTYPTLRSAQTNANVTAGVDRKFYMNKLQNGGVYTSNYRIDNMVLGFSANHYDGFGGGGVTQGGVTLTKGHLVFVANNPNNYGTTTPTTFTKINLNMSRNQQLIPDELILNTSISGQMASVDLDSAEKFYLGGPNGVRGYPGSQGGGSQGGMLNVELQKSLENKMVALAFYDTGFVHQYKTAKLYNEMKGSTGASNSYSLRSVGVGLKRAGQDIIWSVSVAWKLGHNPLLNNNGKGVNNDGRSNSAYVWSQVQWVF